MNHILVGLDASDNAPNVLRVAVELAQKTGAKLRLLQVVGIPPEIPAHFYETGNGDLAGLLLGQAKTHLDGLATRAPAELLTSVEVEIGAPWDGICRSAKKHNVDLIVIGSHGYRGLDRVLGTTAAKVVNHADRSVLIARHPEQLQF